MRARRAEYVFNGKPCKNGHVGPRYKSGNCVECLLERERLKQADPRHAEQKRAREKARYSSKPEAYSEKQKERRASNPNRFKEYASRTYRRNEARRRHDSKNYRERNIERVLERDRKYHHENKAARNQKARDYRQKNPPDRDAVKRYSSDHFRRNKSRYAARNARKRAALALATPVWANTWAISEIYAKAAALEIETGIRMSVDHIIPIRACIRGIGQVACGLHVESNLRIIPLAKNKQLNAYGWFDEFGHLPYKDWPKGNELSVK